MLAVVINKQSQVSCFNIRNITCGQEAEVIESLFFSQREKGWNDCVHSVEETTQFFVGVVGEEEVKPLKIEQSSVNRV